MERPLVGAVAVATALGREGSFFVCILTTDRPGPGPAGEVGDVGEREGVVGTGGTPA